MEERISIRWLKSDRDEVERGEELDGGSRRQGRRDLRGRLRRHARHRSPRRGTRWQSGRRSRPGRRLRGWRLRDEGRPTPTRPRRRGNTPTRDQEELTPRTPARGGGRTSHRRTISSPGNGQPSQTQPPHQGAGVLRRRRRRRRPVKACPVGEDDGARDRRRARPARGQAARMGTWSRPTSGPRPRAAGSAGRGGRRRRRRGGGAAAAAEERPAEEEHAAPVIPGDKDGEAAATSPVGPSAPAADGRAADGRVEGDRARLRRATEVDMAAAVEVREQLQGRRRRRPGALVQRLRDQGDRACPARLPRANGAYTRRRVRALRSVNVGVAVAAARTRWSCRRSSTPTGSALGEIARSHACSPSASAPARSRRRADRRHLHGLEPRHVRRRALRRDDQPAAGGDPRGRSARRGRRSRRRRDGRAP